MSSLPFSVSCLARKLTHLAVFDNAFTKEITNISVTHGFWVKVMANVIDQDETYSDIHTIMQRLMSSKAMSSSSCDPCPTTAKIICNVIVASSGPTIL